MCDVGGKGHRALPRRTHRRPWWRGEVHAEVTAAEPGLRWIESFDDRSVDRLGPRVRGRAGGRRNEKQERDEDDEQKTSHGRPPRERAEPTGGRSRGSTPNLAHRCDSRVVVTELRLKAKLRAHGQVTMPRSG